MEREGQVSVKTCKELPRPATATESEGRVSVCEEGRDNIDDDELITFRLLAKSYAGLTELQVAQLVSGKHFVEICRDDKA